VSTPIASIISLCILRPPPTPTLFPYTTLFRSEAPPARVRIHFVKAEESAVLTEEACARIEEAGRRNGRVRLHRVAGGHWVNADRSEEHTSELQSRENLVCRLLLEKKKKRRNRH